jgi:hypothetical protein
MNLNNQKTLVSIHKELATALQWQPSHRCKRCKVLATKLASITALYSEILDGVIRKEIRQSYARRILSILLEAVKSLTRVS